MKRLFCTDLHPVGVFLLDGQKEPKAAGDGQDKIAARSASSYIVLSPDPITGAALPRTDSALPARILGWSPLPRRALRPDMA